MVTKYSVFSCTERGLNGYKARRYYVAQEGSTNHYGPFKTRRQAEKQLAVLESVRTQVAYETAAASAEVSA